MNEDHIILYFDILGSEGISDNGDDTYTVTGLNRLATDAEVLAANQALSLDTIRTEAATLIKSKWPAWRQNNCALGVYPDTVVTECADDIAAVIAASNTAEDSIEAATTVTEVEAVTPTWPVL